MKIDQDVRGVERSFGDFHVTGQDVRVIDSNIGNLDDSRLYVNVFNAEAQKEAEFAKREVFFWKISI